MIFLSDSVISNPKRHAKAPLNLKKKPVSLIKSFQGRKSRTYLVHLISLCLKVIIGVKLNFPESSYACD